MEGRDTERFAACIATLALAYRTDLDDAAVELYFRALEDVPMHLLEAASVELARTSSFFPKVAEWRRAVDTILERDHRLQPPLKWQQAALPGTVLPGAIEEWRCPDCDNTGWVYTTMQCERRVCLEARDVEGPHSHTATTRCTNPQCLDYRAALRARKRRYGMPED
jgi:hypothetical protein